MIRLPLDQHRGGGTVPQEVVVELNEEGYAVDLTIELEPGEVAPFLPAATREPDVLVMAEGDELQMAQQRNRQLRENLELLRDELADLRKRIIDARDRADVSRRLLPDEARALAAMLVHFAAEAERR